MKNFLCLLLILALLPVCALAGETPAIELEGEWYMAMLYGYYVWPMAEAARSADEVPESLAEFLCLEAPGFAELTEDAVLIYELRDGGVLLALERREAEGWRCYPGAPGSPIVMLRFEGGKAVPVGMADALDYTFDGETLSLSFGGEAMTGAVVPYGADAFEMRFAEEERVEGINFGVPTVLFVRRSVTELE